MFHYAKSIAKVQITKAKTRSQSMFLDCYEAFTGTTKIINVPSTQKHSLIYIIKVSEVTSLLKKKYYSDVVIVIVSFLSQSSYASKLALQKYLILFSIWKRRRFSKSFYIKKKEAPNICFILKISFFSSSHYYWV